MNTKRLATLSKYLREHVSTLNMSEWTDECGAASCAFGHACTILEFQQAGLHLACCQPDYFPAYENQTRYWAAAKFFDIPHEKALFLFDPEHYRQAIRYEDEYVVVHPSVVADRIDALIAEG